MEFCMVQYIECKISFTKFVLCIVCERVMDEWLDDGFQIWVEMSSVQDIWSVLIIFIR